MQPPTDDQVWISKEEYQRLQQAAAQNGTIASNSLVVGTSAPVAAQSSFSRMQIITGACLALAFYGSLVAPILHLLLLPIVLGFIAFAFFSMRDYYRNRSRVTGPVRESTAKPKHSPYKVILILLIAAVLTPILAYAALIVFLIALFSAGGGPSS